MKYRVENQGIHLYDRNTGYHILMDEVDTNSLHKSIAPRTISVAITNFCDFACPHCYVPMNGGYMKTEKIIKWALEFDKYGTFEFSLGGGEPTLHPDFVNLCKQIWEKTQLGISITTHGYHLKKEMIDKITGNISFIRVSIDGIENVYSLMRKNEFSPLVDNLKYLKNKIPFGINTVICSKTLPDLDNVLNFSLDIGAEEILLLPIVSKGKFAMRNSEWDNLNSWINLNYKKINISINKDARNFLKVPFLFNKEELSESFAYIGADETFRTSSYLQEGLKIADFNSIKDMLYIWNETNIN